MDNSVGKNTSEFNGNPLVAAQNSLPLAQGLSENTEISNKFHPKDVNPHYVEFMAIRQQILDVIRQPSNREIKLVADILDELLKRDKDIPSGLLSAIAAILGMGKRIRELRRKREIYERVAISLLEQIFDPELQFKMTKKEIRDAFQANGIPRDKIAPQQITQIYVMILHSLKTGELRDLTFEVGFHKYVRLKIDEISYSRYDWELNE